MNITKIRLIDTELTELVKYYIYNVDVLKGNITNLAETERGVTIDCNINISQRKLNKLKLNMKEFTNASAILTTFVTDDWAE